MEHVTCKLRFQPWLRKHGGGVVRYCHYEGLLLITFPHYWVTSHKVSLNNWKDAAARFE